jgi:hypothetical protein
MQGYPGFVVLLLVLAGPLVSQEAPPPAAGFDADAAVRQGLARLLELQEGDDRDQWPYEGVYRADRGALPVGYRVGGTAIVCLSLLAAPGLAGDEPREKALRRGVEFVLKTLEHDRMQIGFIGSYDVRNWGHVYALQLFTGIGSCATLSKELRGRCERKVPWLVQALGEMALPSGGWNYSHSGGYKNPRARASPFMTGPALQALFAAQQLGHKVPDEVIEQALDALERARTGPGGYAYGAPGNAMGEIQEDKLGMMDKTPGSVARAACVETTLLLAGRGDRARHAVAVERFFEHWDALEVRRKKTGTHIPPYGVAPYYFLYGHWYAAQAIELLDDPALRQRQRARLWQLLQRTREEDGSWNDRQFGRSAGYGTALAILCLRMQHLPKPAARPMEKKGG